MRANTVRLPLHALAYNLANFLRTLALPEEIERWSLTRCERRSLKIGAKIVTHARYTVFQMAEVAVPQDVFHRILKPHRQDTIMQRGSVLMLARLRIAYRKGGVRPECARGPPPRRRSGTAHPRSGAFSPIQPATR